MPFPILGLPGHKISLISISDSANRRLDPFQNRKVLDTALRTKFNTVDGEKRFTDSEERHLERFPIKEGARHDAFGTSNLDKCSNPLAKHPRLQ